MGAISEGARLLSLRPELAREIATAVGVSRSLVAAWVVGNRLPAEAKRAELEAAYGVPAASWAQPAAEREPQPIPAPLSPSERPGFAPAWPRPQLPAAAPALPSAAELPAVQGTVLDRARLLLSYLAVPGRSAAEIAQAREIRAALTLEGRIAGELAARQRKLEDHPDFEPFLDRIVVALRSVPGALEVLERAMSEDQ